MLVPEGVGSRKAPTLALDGDLGLAGVELEFAAVLADLDVVDLKVDQVAAAIADVGAALLDALAVAVEVELAVVELDVDSAQAHAFAVDAGKVGLAADLGR